MKHQAIYIITLMSVCCRGAYGMRGVSPIGNCPRCKKFDVSTFEPLKRVAMIKAEIMRRLGIPQQQSERNTELTTKREPTLDQRQRKTNIDDIDKNIQGDDTHELSELLSYSELSENFTDEHIIQFKVSGQSGQHLLVQSANLVIRVKCKQPQVKEQRSSTGERKKRRGKHRTVTLVIYSVDAEGKPGKQLTSIKSKLRKTKWLRMNLPKDIVQTAVDSKERTLQVYVKCVGCDKKTRLILAQKGRKRHHLTRKLHKRRPILYLHSQIQSNRERKRRSTTEYAECSTNNNTVCYCEKTMVEFDLINDFGWNWMIYPTRFKSLVCRYRCNNIIISNLHEQNVRDQLESEDRTREICRPVLSPQPLGMLYFDANEVKYSQIRNILVTDCLCDT